jgi:dihydrofolate reductase
MARLLYLAIASLDGYIADEQGSFAWAAPDEEVHRFVNDIVRSVGTGLYGRGMYEVMVAWETMDTSGEPECMRDFAELWRATDKVVYSTTLDAPASERTRIARSFDAAAVEQMKAREDRDLSIGGPALAAHAFAAGLVDDVHLILAPVLVGSGKRALPETVRGDLELVDAGRFESGFVHLHHRAAR